VTPRPLHVEEFLPADYLAEALRADVARGLTATPKELPPKWFYDERGSVLFEEITRLPEYYPTRAEREILAARAGEVAGRTDAVALVELGSGSAEKTRLLLTALTGGRAAAPGSGRGAAPGSGPGGGPAGLAGAGTLRRYLPVDVSRSALLESGQALVAEYPGLAIQPVLADFTHQLSVLPGLLAGTGPRLTAFLGGTIGNFEPAPRAEFLAELRAATTAGDWLLLGTDLVKDPAVLVPAYADAAGVTAEFNRNVLHVINRELKADFDVEAYQHVARWDADQEWIEMRLRSTRDQEVNIADLDLGVRFAAGEELRTEVSAKFRPDRVRAELAAAGFAVEQWWADHAGRFALTLARAR
jgi:L-histidine N-alpha-methyltransferase